QPVPWLWRADPSLRIERLLASRTSIVRSGQLLCRSFRSHFLQALFPRIRTPAALPLQGQVRSIIIELAGLPLRPLVESRDIHQNLTVRSFLDMGPVHGTRRRTLKVDSFAVVTTAVARAFKFVIAGFPVGRAAQMRAARVNHEHAIGCAVHPDAVLLLKLGVHAQAVIFGIADLKAGRGLEERARQKKAEEGDEPRGEERSYGRPHQSPALLIDRIVFRTDRSYSSAGCRFRSPHRRCADIFGRSAAACDR